MNRKAMVFVLVLIGGCGDSSSPPQGGPPPTIKATKRTFSSSVSALGAIKPQVGSEVRVGARISGRVERLHANLKDRVEKGQVLAALEKADLEAALAERAAAVAVAESRLAALEALGPREIEKAQADVKRWEATSTLARKELTRQQDLLKQEFTSQQLQDEAQEKLEVAEAQGVAAGKTLELVRTQVAEGIKQGRAELERARAAHRQTTVELSYATIVAPISGVVASVSTQEGETVAAGLSAPTFVTIVDLARLQVDAYVDEVDIGKVQLGQPATFTVEAYPASEFRGKVVAIYPKAVIQDNVVKYVVAVEISSDYEGKLRPDMTANVTLQLESRTVLAVPAKAVRRERGKSLVYLNSPGGAQPKEVKLGWKEGLWVEVAGGLEEGQEILLEPPAPRVEEKGERRG